MEESNNSNKNATMRQVFSDCHSWFPSMIGNTKPAFNRAAFNFMLLERLVEYEDLVRRTQGIELGYVADFIKLIENKQLDQKVNEWAVVDEEYFKREIPTID